MTRENIVMSGHYQALLVIVLVTLFFSVSRVSACLPFFTFPTFPAPAPATSTTSSVASSGSSSSSSVTRKPFGNATDCGQKGGGRVVGGEDAAQHEFPWHCALLNSEGRYYGCSATLVSCDPVIAITAAHCIPKINLPLITIKLRTPKFLACGRNKIKSEEDPGKFEPNEQRLKITNVVTHPDYNGDTFANDIAVIKVENSFNCKKRVLYPACLPSKHDLSYEGWEATTVSGWGRTSEDGETSKTLKKAKIPVVSNQVCKETMKKQKEAPPVTSGMMCGGHASGGTDSCQGDSGGPLVTTSQSRRKRSAKNGWSLVGVVSWGLGCARPDSFGVYTRVSHYIDWIAKQYGLSI